MKTFVGVRLAAGLVTVAAVLVAASSATPAAAAGPGALTVARVTADAERNPLGVDVTRPRLAWVLRSHERGQGQSAFQVVVGTSPGKLARGQGDVWDSGKVASTESTGISYGGPPLRSATRYYWKVRVWDREDRPSPWSPIARWEMGLLSDADWGGATWIGDPPTRLSLRGASWIWYPEGNPAQSAPAATRWLRRTFVLPAGSDIAGAQMALTADNEYDLYVNGQQVAASPPVDESWREAQVIDLADVLREGANTLAIEAVNRAVTPAGVLGRLRVERPGSEPFELVTDGSWKASDAAPAGWQQPGFDDSSWPAAVAAASYGQGPWGTGTSIAARGPLLRREFAVTKEVERARVYVSGLGYYVLSIDGKRVGDSVLDPGFTVYDETALYATHDVTSAVRKRGAHALGVALGRGFYGLPAADTNYWGAAPWRGDPRLRMKLEVDYTDGSRETVVSDESWQVRGGPTVRDSIYMGETHDARLVQPGWDRPGFDAEDKGWRPASELAAPTSNLRSQRMEPIRVVDTMRADRITSPKPGTYVFRFPVVTAGWLRLRVNGRAGTEVTLRYGERLRADGTVNNDGDPGLTSGSIQTDRYVLRGAGTETWEPSFSYKGFQYVQVDGYPGRPTADDLVARVVHSDVPSTGEFRSSSKLLNTIHAITRRTILNNLHSIFAADPMFEKRGWLDDASLLTPTTTDNFGIRRFYRNWLTSIVDNQGANGAGVELSPNPLPAGYTDPIWAGALVLVPWQLYQDYGDHDVLAANYGAMVRYVDYLTAQADGFIQRGFYGDWASPNPIPGHVTEAFTPPEGPRLSATAYFYKHAVVTARAARVLGHDDDATRFTALAERIKDAFNAEFLDPDIGAYGLGFRVQDGALVADARPHVSPLPVTRSGVTLLREGSGWADYDVSARVSVDRGAAGLMVRSQDERNGYLVGLRPDGGVDVWRQVNGAFSLLHFGAASPSFDPAALHDLVVSLRGNRIMPSLDGVPLPTVTDGTFERGRVGVRAVADQRSRWDRLTVTGPDGELFYDETFDTEEALTAFADIGYRQTPNALALTFGLVPDELVDEVTQNLVADVRARGNHLTTGATGTKELLPALTEQGHVDTALAIATQRTYPSWGYQIDNGATTLWERWETSSRSLDIAFQGSIDDWFYRYLAGIQPAAPGYARIAVRPYVPTGLERASASMETVRGTVSSGWTKARGGSLRLDVTIPANATAEVAVPARSAAAVTERARPAADAEGVRFLRMDGDRALLEVGSGTYRFRTTP